MKENVEKILGELIVLHSRKNINIEDINDDTLLIEELGYDSVDLVLLMVQIEEKFGVEFGNTEMIVENINCFGKMKEFISKQLQ